MPGTHYAPILSFAIAYGLIWWLVTRPWKRLPVDTPNSRSLHSTPIPRTGGIGLHAGIIAAAVISAISIPATLWVSVILLLTVSFIDDIRSLSARWRLIAHLLGAGLFAMPLLLANHYGMLAVALVTIAIGWMINLYNFMDGSDGLAGGMTLFGFSSFAVAAWLAGSTDLALLNACIAAAAAAFLVFNFHPARIFLGDAGSVPLGFLAAALGHVGWLQGDWAWWFPLLVFSPFIVDASVTLFRRLFSGGCVWEAHRDHYYQRLVQMGFGHRGTALAEYALMLACSIAALWAMTLTTHAQYILLTIVLLLYAMIIGLIERAWRKRHESNA
jgi:UDP-GlcNAc:undecaprenyl-phosphate GlcNAc-1-phosphate transferase